MLSSGLMHYGSRLTSSTRLVSDCQAKIIVKKEGSRYNRSNFPPIVRARRVKHTFFSNTNSAARTHHIPSAMPFLYELILCRLQSYRSASSPHASGLTDKPSNRVSTTSATLKPLVGEDLPLSDTSVGSEVSVAGLTLDEVNIEDESYESESVSSDESMDVPNASDAESASEHVESDLDDLDVDDGIQYDGRIKTKADLTSRLESVSGYTFMPVFFLSLGVIHI